MRRLLVDRRWPAVATFLVMLAASPAALAGAVLQPPLVNVTAGRLGIDRDVDDPTTYGLEYRHRPVGRWQLVPAIGAARAENGASFVYAEVKRDFRFASGVVVTPSFGLARFEESVELRLGQALEFRSGLELAYEMRSGWRLGLALYHLSNAGLAPENPGSEGLVVSISLPTD
ncbi:MAG TPA: acyloxyacyl hydrolase [Woeseiaceae bacterium]|nr:acyloxyacyl hydrolase [Woeseiaceae bacterium]